MLHQHYVVHTALVLNANTINVTQCQVKRVGKNQDTGSFLSLRDETVTRVPSQFPFSYLDPNYIYGLLCPSLLLAQQQLVALGLLFIDATQSHTARYTTLGRASRSEWSARRRFLYLSTHNTHSKHACLRRDSKPQSQLASSRKPAHYAAWPLGLALSVAVWTNTPFCHILYLRVSYGSRNNYRLLSQEEVTSWCLWLKSTVFSAGDEVTFM
jgi:hypothetical protein